MRIRPFVIFAFLCMSYVCGNGQATKNSIILKPVISAEEETLRKLLAIAKDPAHNGMSLADTVSPNNKYSVGHTTTLPFPGALHTYMGYREVSYKGNMANIFYTWIALIAKTSKQDTLTINKNIGRVQQLIIRLLPNIRDSFYTVTDVNYSTLTWQWLVANGIKLQLKSVSSVKYNIPDEISLNLTVSKSLVQDKQKIIDQLYTKYATLTAEATTRKDASSYCYSLFRFLRQEGLTEQETIEKIKLLFKSLADKDIAAGFDVLIKMNTTASNSLQALLTVQQLATVKKLAQGVVDEYNRAWQAKNKPQVKEVEPKKPAPKSRHSTYNTIYKNIVNSSYVYVNTHDDSLHKFKIQNIWITPKAGNMSSWSMGRSASYMVDESFFHPNANWIAVDIKNCHRCSGTGWDVTKTPYTYYREEYGIYNKYTYSGTGYNVKTEVCKMCNGTGYSVYPIYW